MRITAIDTVVVHALAHLPQLPNLRCVQIDQFHGASLGPHGHPYDAVRGAGFSLVLASDVRFAAPEARMNAAYIRVGVGGCDMGSGYLLPRLIGLSVASELLLTGRFLGADRAKAVGLVSDVVPGEQLDTRAAELTQRLARFAPQAVTYAKEAVRRGSELPLAEGLQLERDLAAVLMATEDRIEAASAFRERRKPVFRGR